MKLISYQVHNVLRIADLDLNMEGRNLALIGGANGQGKTSALKAFLMACCGRSGMDFPDVVLKEGEDEGSITVNLSGDSELHDLHGFTIKQNFRRGRGGVVTENFQLLDSAGDEAGSPRELLRSLYSMRAFDPLSFERSKPKEQQETLRELVGLDFTELDEERKTVYAERTVINTAGKAARVRFEEAVQVEDPPEKEVSVKDLFLRLEAIQRTNSTIEAEKRKLNDLKARDEELAEKEAKLKAKLAELDMERQNVDGLIEEQVEVIQDLPEPQEEEPIREQISNADRINERFRLAQKAAELKAELDDLTAKSKAKTARLKAIDKEKADRIENAEWPLPGLAVDDKGVTLDGLPFEQASKAQRVLASVKIGMALNPKLRLFVCEDGNDLDNETLAALDQALKDNDFQMLLEFVTRTKDDEDRCAVVFHEGKTLDATAMDTDDMLAEKEDGEEEGDEEASEEEGIDDPAGVEKPF